MPYQTPPTFTPEEVTTPEDMQVITDNQEFLKSKALCRVYRSTNQSIANNTDAAISFNSETVDTVGMHESVTHPTRITVPTGYAGKYLVQGQVYFDFDVDGDRTAVLKVNGTTVVSTGQEPAVTVSTKPTVVAVSGLVVLAEADYIELIAHHVAGAALDAIGGPDKLYLEAILLGV